MNQIVVGIAEFKLAEPPGVLVTYGLGSCVAIALHSGKAAVGSLAHIMLPLAYEKEENRSPGKFADSAVAAMVRQMGTRGIEPSGLVAKIAGGAQMFAGQFKGPGRRIGVRNILAVQKALSNFEIRLVAQDVGGTAGRTVEFTTGTGRFVIKTLKGEVREL